MEQAENKSKKSKFNSRVLTQKNLVVALLVALLFVTGLLSYVILRQRQKTETVSAKLSKASQQITYLHDQQTASDKRLTTLTNANNKLMAEIASETTSSKTKSTTPTDTTTSSAASTAPKLTISVTGGSKYTPPSGSQQTFIAVKATFTNSGTTTFTLPVSNFRLLDSYGNISPDFAEHAGETLPDGLTVLSDVSLSPGQTVNGALLFGVMNSNLDNYTFKYDTQSFAVNAG